MTVTLKPLAGHGGAVRSATILPFRRTHDARKVQDLVRAVRHRQVAEALALGAMAAVEVLVEHAVARGGLDQAGTLGLQLAVAGARDAASELAVAHKAVEVAAGKVDHA